MNRDENLKIKNSQQLEDKAAKLKKLEEKSLKKAKGFVNEFKQFATKGNVIDMAVGVIIANAFTKIVNSLVNDVITPMITIFTGKLDYTNLFIALDGNAYSTLEEAKAAGVSIIAYGTFLTNVLNFLMVAFWLFIFLRVIFKVKSYKTKEQKQEVVVTTKKCPYCLNEIPLAATKCGHCTSDVE